MTDVRAFIEVGPGTKVRLRQAIEALIDVLDSWEADPELEEGGDDELTGDDEPTLGATAGMHQGHAWNVRTDEGGEDEPSLGWCGVGQGCHGNGAAGYADDLEEQHDREHEMTDENGIGDGLNKHMAIS